MDWPALKKHDQESQVNIGSENSWKQSVILPEGERREVQYYLYTCTPQSGAIENKFQNGEAVL